jgi:hypothetical protein
LRLGEIARRVAFQAKKEENVINALDRSVLGKIANADGHGVAPEALGNKIFTEGVHSKHVRQVVNIYDAAPNSVALNKAWKESVGHSIWEKITSDGILSPTQLGNLLDKKGSVIAAAMGPQYLADLRIMQKSLAANRSNVTGYALEKTGLLGRLLRATPVAPPLSMRGRFQTFVQMIRWNASNRALIAGIKDPQILRAIVYNAERNITDRRSLRILSQLGATGAAIGDDGTLPTPEE